MEQLTEILPYLLGVPGTGYSIWSIITNHRKNKAAGDVAQLEAESKASDFYKGVFKDQKEAFSEASRDLIESVQAITKLEAKATALAEENIRLSKVNDRQHAQLQEQSKEIERLREEIRNLRNAAQEEDQ